VRARHPPHEPVVLVITGRIARKHIAGLCRRTRAMLEDGDSDLLVCDVGAIVAPDAVTVDALARLQLTARRCGGQIQLRDACDELHDLLRLMGLRDVVPRWMELPVEARGKAEEREQSRGVQEESDSGDSTV
jgi:ABC-type transporter Mla MlaB component